MKILFLTHYFYPEGNAPATRTYEHCKCWVKQGHSVTVVTCAPNCPSGVVYDGYKNRLFCKETIDGITVVRLWTFLAPNKGFFRRILNYLSYMAAACLYSACQFRKPDVLIATSPQFFCGWAGVVCRFFRRWPFILEIRDIWPESITTVGAMKKSLIIRILEKMETIMYRSADHIVAVGNGYKKKITDKGIPQEKVSVITNGVMPDFFTREPAEKALRSKYGSVGKFVCAYIGTVGMAHGLEVVLKAADAAGSGRFDDVVFWIVGDGAERESLEEKAKAMKLENVVFTGRLPKEMMQSVIAECDAVLVHLRGSELFGTVIPSKIFEFMAGNLPIIMGVKGPALEIVLESSGGVEMTPDDPESLLKSIDAIRQSPPDTFRGRNYVMKHYNRERLAGEMIAICKQCASLGVVGKS